MEGGNREAMVSTLSWLSVKGVRVEVGEDPEFCSDRPYRNRFRL